MTPRELARYADVRDGRAVEHAPEGTILLQAAPGEALVVPHGTLLLVADFVRQGADLLLVGPADDDLIKDLAGADTLIGGAGGDELVGGAGIDTASYDGAMLARRAP